MADCKVMVIVLTIFDEDIDLSYFPKYNDIFIEKPVDTKVNIIKTLFTYGNND